MSTEVKKISEEALEQVIGGYVPWYLRLPEVLCDDCGDDHRSVGNSTVDTWLKEYSKRDKINSTVEIIFRNTLIHLERNTKMRELKREDLQMISGGTYEEALAYAKEISGKYGIEIDDDLNGLKELIQVCTDEEHRKMIDLYHKQ